MENKYENNPYAKNLKIPVSTQITGQVADIAPSKQHLQEESDDGSAKIGALNIKMSPALHQKFKISCLLKGISMQDAVLKFIKKEVEKEDKKNK